ncbi:MAG: class I adenylate-forming enzyme family protein, partial [Coriobacteriales bacterium]
MTAYRNIVEPALACAARMPDRLAVVYEDTRLTYRELDELSRRIARVFLACGIQPGDRIAYLLPNRPELIAVYIAVQRIGAVAVPLNYRLIPREIAYLVNSVEASTLVFDQQFIDALRQAKGQLDSSVKLISVGKPTEFSQRLYDMEVEMGSGELPLYLGGGPSRIQFTGGSTGTPKGALRSHEADLCEIRAVSASNGMDAMEHPVAVVQCPLEHHGGHSWFASCLAIGATVVVCGKFDPDKIYAQIQEHQATHVILLPPITYLRLVHDGHPELFDRSSVSIIQSAAGGITPEIV